VTGQSQAGGHGSTNVQAAGDVVVHAGASLEEVRQIALDVFHANFLELRGHAEQVAGERAERITNAFLVALQQRAPQALESASNPDMQRALFSAQREYACSGDEDLETVLVDLLVDRAGEGSSRGVRTIVLNEAINAAPKLTSHQRRAIAVCFLMRYTRPHGQGTVDAFYEHFVRDNLVPLGRGLPTSDTDYQHIEYVGAGSMSLLSPEFGDALVGKARGLFTRGFTRQETSEILGELLDDPRVVMPCLRDEARLQLQVVHRDDIPAWAESLGCPDREQTLRNVLDMGLLSSEEAQREMVEREPATRELIDAWQSSSLHNLRLTTVGLAIGHGYWRRVTGGDSPLNVWLSD